MTYRIVGDPGTVVGDGRMVLRQASREGRGEYETC